MYFNTHDVYVNYNITIVRILILVGQSKKDLHNVAVGSDQTSKPFSILCKEVVGINFTLNALTTLHKKQTKSIQLGTYKLVIKLPI